MTERTLAEVMAGRIRSVHPTRKSKYTHYPIIAVRNGIGVTEDGESVFNLPLFSYNKGPHIWVMYGESDDLFVTLNAAFGKYPWFIYVLSGSEPIPSEHEALPVMVPPPRFTTFGFDSKVNGVTTAAPGRRRTRRHRILDLASVFSDDGNASEFGSDHGTLLKFASDFRTWHLEQDLPIPSSLAGGASHLLRDGRFWPHSRGRVPRATNERMRPHLPGNMQLQTAERYRRYKEVLSLDLRRAYHNAALTTPTPDPTSLMARGWFADPECGEIYARPGTELYARWVGQPGLLCVIATCRPPRPHEFRPPACEAFPDGFRTATPVYVYTHELALCVKHGMLIQGIVAAWTSEHADTGLPLYAQFALAQNEVASEYRAQWIKPMLLTAYGLYATRARHLFSCTPPTGGDDDATVWVGGPRKVRRRRVRASPVPVICNVLTLGVLQARIRAIVVEEANNLTRQGVMVLGVHADAIHAIPAQLELEIDARFKASLLTDLTYCEGDNAWICEQETILPGLHGDERHERTKRRAYILARATTTSSSG